MHPRRDRPGGSPSHLARWLCLGTMACASAPAVPTRDGATVDALAERDATAVDAGSDGGSDAGSVVMADAGVEDPPAGTWARRTNLIEPNSEMSVADANGRIYVLGGYPSTRASVSTVQVYDPAQDRWSLGPPLPVALNHTMAVGVAGRVYLIGGQTSAGGMGPFVNTVYMLDPARGEWTTRAPMPTARGGGGCAALDGKIYVAGGRPPRGSDFAVYDPAEDRWETLPNLPTQRNHVGVVAVDGRIYVLGGRFDAGFESPMTDRVEAFDPRTRTWVARRSLPRPRGGVNAVAAHGFVHVFGGEGNRESTTGVFPDHDVYDPTRDTWTALAPMPNPVHGVTGASFLAGWIHLPGGGISQGGSSGTTLHQVYRPARTYP